jgi:hypothetical protein
MDVILEKPNFLFLSGIGKSDVVTIEEQMINKCYTIAQNSEFNIIDEKNKNIVSDIKKCLNCTRIISDDTQSAFIPTFVKETLHNTIEFGKYGQTCSFNCAVTEIISSTNDGSTERDKFLNNLKILFYVKNGYHIIDIKPAPKKNILKEYGGEWTSEQFTLEMNKLNNYKKFVKSNFTENDSKNIFNNISNMIQKNNISKIITNNGGNKIIFTNLGTMQSNKRTIRSIYSNNKIMVCDLDGINYPHCATKSTAPKLTAPKLTATKSTAPKLIAPKSIATSNSIINEFFK